MLWEKYACIIKGFIIIHVEKGIWVEVALAILIFPFPTLREFVFMTLIMFS